MRTKELREFLNKLDERYNEHELSIVVSKNNAFGGTPKIGIKFISIGFDFDSGHIIIEPSQTLITKK